jgi:hypothetical protein
MDERAWSESSRCGSCILLLVRARDESEAARETAEHAVRVSDRLKESKNIVFMVWRIEAT